MLPSALAPPANVNELPGKLIVAYVPWNSMYPWHCVAHVVPLRSVKEPTTAPEGITTLVVLLAAPGGSKVAEKRPFLDTRKPWVTLVAPKLPQAGSEQVAPDISPEGLMLLREVPAAPG